MKITAEMLRDKKACALQVKIFKREWPDGAVINLKNIMRAQELELDIDYAAQFLFPPAAWTKYQTAMAAEWAKFQTATVAAWKKYQTATAVAWKEFETAWAAAFLAASKIQ